MSTPRSHSTHCLIEHTVYSKNRKLRYYTIRDEPMAFAQVFDIQEGNG